MKSRRNNTTSANRAKCPCGNCFPTRNAWVTAHCRIVCSKKTANITFRIRFRIRAIEGGDGMKKEIRNCARILDKARKQAGRPTSKEQRTQTNIERIKEKAQEMGIKLAEE